MKTERLLEILGISDPEDISRVLLENLLGENKNTILGELKKETAGALDIFRNFYEEEIARRKSLKQDYTPNSICEIVSSVAGLGGVVLDVCAGSGSLTLEYYNQHKGEYILEEFSKTVIPFLISNLAIKNTNGIVIHCDVLTREVFTVYRLTKGDEYSNITILDDTQAFYQECDNTIMNPPYSMKWQGVKDERLEGYDMPPKSKADYMFILHGLKKTKNKLVAVLPHGILFRGQAEGRIRQKLIENNLIETVIGLPDKLFTNTSIPVCIVVFNKHKTNNEILFIDASKEYKKQSKINLMEKEHINKVLDYYKSGREEDGFSRFISYDEIKENDFNLNIPRYVNSFEEEKTIPMDIVMRELVNIEKEQEQKRKKIVEMFNNLVATTEESKIELERTKRILREWIK